MGTSAARKAPGGKFWRTAKTTASRFAAGKEASPPGAKDVVARYLTALESQEAAGLGVAQTMLPDVVRTAAALSNFCRRWQQDGWDAALASLGSNPAPMPTREEIIPVLLDELAGPGATLDQAVARAALSDHLGSVWPAEEKLVLSPDMQHLDRAAAVPTFLSLALFRKLLSDLGEHLEFFAPSLNLGAQRQAELKSYILGGLQNLVRSEALNRPLAADQAAVLLQRLVKHLSRGHER